MEFNFRVEEPEENIASVIQTQIITYLSKNDELVVVVYLMENSAYEITEGFAKSSMGKVKLQYQSHSPSGAATACVRLRKLVYSFPNHQTMPKFIEFDGKK